MLFMHVDNPGGETHTHTHSSVHIFLSEDIHTLENHRKHTKLDAYSSIRQRCEDTMNTEPSQLLLLSWKSLTEKVYNWFHKFLVLLTNHSVALRLCLCLQVQRPSLCSFLSLPSPLSLFFLFASISVSSHISIIYVFPCQALQVHRGGVGTLLVR